MGIVVIGLVDRDECLIQSDVPVIVWFLLRGLFASVGRRRGRLTAGGVCVVVLEEGSNTYCILRSAYVVVWRVIELAGLITC